MRFMKFTRPVAAAITAGLALQAVAAHAHFVWVTVEKGQARFALLENANEAPNVQFASYVDKLTARANGKTLAPGEVKDGARYVVLPTGFATGKGAVEGESVAGVRERNGETYLLVYHAKGALSLASAQAMTKAPAELLARRVGNNLVVSARQDGWPVPQAEVWVQWPGDETAISVKTDINGDAQVAWPAPAKLRGGFVGVRTMIKETKTGERDGKKYPAVHRWATLTFPVAAAAPAPAPSFGTNDRAAKK